MVKQSLSQILSNTTSRGKEEVEVGSEDEVQVGVPLTQEVDPVTCARAKLLMIIRHPIVKRTKLRNKGVSG